MRCPPLARSAPLFAFLSRAFGVACLALTVVLAVLDLTRSVAGSQIVWTSFDRSWSSASPSTRAAAEATVVGTAGEAIWGALAVALALPGWAILGALAFVLLWLGRRRRSAYARFARE